jgi:putative PIN family toxin of toxin-antitoxin system
MGKKEKVIFDTNVWISLFLKRTLAQEFSEIINRQVTIFISKEILVEISRVLTYPKIKQIIEGSEINAKQILRFIAENTTIVDPKIRVKLIGEDSQDNKILECALAAGADYIVTGDSHLLKVGKFKQTKIITPRAFLDYCSAK